MTAGQLAALIAAVSFAVLACAGVVALIRLSRLLGVAADAAVSYRERADTLLEQAQGVVDRAHEQLTRTGAITASVDEVTTNMAELSGHVSALTGLAHGLAQALYAPVTGLSALAYGVRHAVALRRPESASPSSPVTGRPEDAAPRLLAARPEGAAQRPLPGHEAPAAARPAPGRGNRSRSVAGTRR
jgi:uncharacterized protein YoxC